MASNAISTHHYYYCARKTLSFHVQAETKKQFKCEECYDILKKRPKWHDYCNKKSLNNCCSTTGSQPVRPSPSTSRTTGSQPVRPSPSTSRTTGSHPVRPSPSPDAYFHENVLNDFIPDNMETQAPVTPMTQSTYPEQEARNKRLGTCTPNLDGPASSKVQHPGGMKNARKAATQRQRRNKQLLQAQSSANQSFTSGLMNMQSETNSKWDKIEEADRMRDLKDDDRYSELRHIHALEHEMKVASKRSKLAQERGVLGQKLLDAIQLLDQIDTLSLLTSSQKRIYEIRKRTVQEYEESYEALEDMLDKFKYISPRFVHREANIASVGVSQKRLFDEDNEVDLGHDS